MPGVEPSNSPDNTIRYIATFAANNYINDHCLDMQMQEKLLTWQQVYDAVIGSISIYRDYVKPSKLVELSVVSRN